MGKLGTVSDDAAYDYSFLGSIIFPSLLVAVLLLLPAADVHADDPLAAIHGLSNTEVHPFKSEHLGRTLNLIVRLPRDYDQEKKQYPVVYLMDGGVLFPLIAGYNQYLRNETFYREPIIVGVGYPGVSFEEGNMRSTDYTAPSTEREYWGGAEQFQHVLEKEVFVFIEKRFRADASRRVLFGQSIGGQFVLYTALTRPELFWGHIASNPALHRNLDFFLQARPGPERSRLFVSLAAQDSERFRIPAARWAEHWQVQNEKPFDLKILRPEGYGHFSVAPESYLRGMTWLFSDPDK